MSRLAEPVGGEGGSAPFGSRERVLLPRRSSPRDHGGDGPGFPPMPSQSLNERSEGTRSYPKGKTGTHDTGHVSEPSVVSGCPCGRSHPDRRAFRRSAIRRPVDRAELAARVYAAEVDGIATIDRAKAQSVLHYAGDCQSPIVIKSYGSSGAVFVLTETRCRKCGPCRRARMWYWCYAAIEQTRAAQAAGLRTWFGTLTVNPAARAELADRAMRTYMETGGSCAVPEWMSEPDCDLRFKLLRDQLQVELQKYWKRLRKAGLQFKYFAVFERHKDGFPHVHYLLHEIDKPILKRELAAEWPHGFTKVKLVGGNAKGQPVSPEKAAFYVTKYLQKSGQSRQIASKLYRPEKLERKRVSPVVGATGAGRSAASSPSKRVEKNERGKLDL